VKITSKTPTLVLVNSMRGSTFASRYDTSRGKRRSCVQEIVVRALVINTSRKDIALWREEFY